MLHVPAEIKSLEDVNPLWVVGYGDGTWRVQFQQAITEGFQTSLAAHNVASFWKRLADEQGYRYAAEAFERATGDVQRFNERA